VSYITLKLTLTLTRTVTFNKRTRCGAHFR